MQLSRVHTNGTVDDRTDQHAIVDVMLTDQRLVNGYGVMVDVEPLVSDNYCPRRP